MQNRPIMEKGISIPKPDIKIVEVTITGKTPLIYHKWAEKAKRQIRDKQQKVAKTGREIRDPKQEYEDSFYTNKAGKIAFPGGSIKKAMVGAARSLETIPMTLIRAAIFVKGDEEGLIEVQYKEKVMREDMVRVGKGSADLRYRGELRGWTMTFNIEYNASIFSVEMVLNLLETAGFSQGLGEWRPERNGDFGQFTVLG